MTLMSQIRWNRSQGRRGWSLLAWMRWMIPLGWSTTTIPPNLLLDVDMMTIGYPIQTQNHLVRKSIRRKTTTQSQGSRRNQMTYPVDLTTGIQMT